jgi:PAS domain S-box-containing protein
MSARGPDTGETDRERILGQLLLLQGALQVMPTVEGLSEFAERALRSVPGVASVHICTAGRPRPPHESFASICGVCGIGKNISGTIIQASCGLKDRPMLRSILLRTQLGSYGYLNLVIDDGERFAPYAQHIENVANVLATNIENRGHKEQMEKANRSLQQEVAERKRTEESLRESEGQIQAIMENAPDGVYLNDLAGNFLYGNRMTEEIIGYKREEIIGKNMMALNLLPSDGLAKAAVLLQDNLGGNSTGPDELILIKKDGTRIIVEINTSLVQRHGQPVVIGFVRDVTERKRVEDLLRLSEDSLREILNSLDGLVYVADMKTYETLFVNRYGKDIWGDFTGKACWQSLQSGQRGPCSFCTNDHLLHPDGTPAGVYVWEFQNTVTGQWFECRDSAILWPDGRTARMEIAIDITERKRVEDKINALLREKELLLKEVHHRIKNNMSSMISLLSLQSTALKNPEAVAALLEARDRMRSMGVLYDKLYRSENLREMSIKDYLPPLVDEIVGVFPNRDLVKIDKRIDDIVLGVKALAPLGIIVNELITNAMKHAFAGRESGSINVSASAKDGRVTLIVEDDGGGIPESVDIENSSGFGLQLVSILTAQLDGAIRIERRKGARFVLEFDA